MQVIIRWITAMLTIFTVFITQNHKACIYAVVLNYQKQGVMSDIIQFDTVIQYNTYNNLETLHPLVSVVDLAKATCTRHKRMNMGIYTVMLKDVICGDMRYGNNYYDYQEGTLIFFAPGQVFSLENEGDDYESRGYALVFHPDLLRSTSLGHRMHEYTFFSYNVNEALHLSE